MVVMAVTVVEMVTVVKQPKTKEFGTLMTHPGS